jgi:hypothetical protein
MLVKEILALRPLFRPSHHLWIRVQGFNNRSVVLVNIKDSLKCVEPQAPPEELLPDWL